jgi:hypothetical protein
MVDDRIRRLSELSDWLGNAEWLDGAFSAVDLLMVMVLRRLSGSDSSVPLCLHSARRVAARPTRVHSSKLYMVLEFKRFKRPDRL